MSLQLGDTFIDAGSCDPKPRLWIVCSLCDGTRPSVVIVSPGTCYDDQAQDTTCPLDVGDHEFINRTSVIVYEYAELRSHVDLTSDLAKGRIKLKEPFDSEILRRILDGFRDSDDALPESFDELTAQGLL